MLEQRIDQGGRSVRAGATGLIAALVATLVVGCAAVVREARPGTEGTERKER